MSANSLESKKEQIKNQIIDWYKTNGRNFPWRKTKNTFHILIAEILLRRTTATAVVRVFPDFISRYDIPEQLASSRITTITKQVATLGLQMSRAHHLKQTASRIVKDFDGNVPNDFEKLSNLPGVGRYVASAVLNFAFGEPFPLVDGNVIHLMSRVFELKFDGPSDEEAWRFMDSFGPDAQSSVFYYGIIDLVATVCTRSSPRCSTCPLSQLCSWNNRRSEPNGTV
jgi:A/G-specific adenine glycosylase